MDEHEAVPNASAVVEWLVVFQSEAAICFHLFEVERRNRKKIVDDELLMISHGTTAQLIRAGRVARVEQRAFKLCVRGAIANRESRYLTRATHSDRWTR